MKGNKNVFPMIIAAIIALVITFIVRYFLPNPSGGAPAKATKELSIPEIPLMVNKEIKKKKEHQVLTIAKDLKKDDKITKDVLAWKKWPEDMVQPNFIAKDEKGHALNNANDYNKAITMWAKSDLPSGSPLTLYMLTSQDPAVRIAEENRKKKEAEAKKVQKKVKESFIKLGMRAITFPIDQRSASASHMMKPGDLIDVLIMEQRGDNSKTHKYKALKILALDGLTELEYKKKQRQGDGGGVGLLGASSGGSSTPKTVTLEIREDMVETMLKQSERSGLILSIRNQKEEVESKEEEETTEGEVKVDANAPAKELSDKEDQIVQSMIEAGNKSVIKAMQEELQDEKAQKNKENIIVNAMNQLKSQSAFESLKNAAEKENKESAMQEALKKQSDALMSSLNSISRDSNRDLLRKEQTEKANMQMLMNSMNLLKSSSPRNTLVEEKEKSKNISELMNAMNSFGGSSMASGMKQRASSKNNIESDEENTVTIYRKLTPTGVEFDEDGKVVTTGKSYTSSQ